MLYDDVEVWDGMGGGREVQEGGDICVPMIDSCGCVAETNPVLQSIHPSIKKSKTETASLGDSDAASLWQLGKH